MNRSKSTGSATADYISVTDCMERYCISRKTVMKLAGEAEALFMPNSTYRIDRAAFDRHFRKAYKA